MKSVGKISKNISLVAILLLVAIGFYFAPKILQADNNNHSNETEISKEAKQHAASQLNNIMPMTVQRETGVVDLSDKQRAALANWLHLKLFPIPGESKNHSTSSGTDKHFYATSSLTVSENLKGGKILMLSDQSKWEVSPKDVSKTSMWLFPYPVRIEKNSKNPQYPYILTNENSHVEIEVRPLPGS